MSGGASSSRTFVSPLGASTTNSKGGADVWALPEIQTSESQNDSDCDLKYSASHRLHIALLDIMSRVLRQVISQPQRF